MEGKQPSKVIADALDYLINGSCENAAQLLKEEYPFNPPQQQGKHSYTDRQKLELWRREHFIDYYTGDRLVFPGSLMILSEVLPEVFPYQINWKTSECHTLWWDLCPTVDHTVAVSKGGLDVVENYHTVSMRTNSAKSLWPEDGFMKQYTLKAGDKDWDGLVGRFIDYFKDGAHAESRQQDTQRGRYLRKWCRVVAQVYGVTL